ncbi:TraM recognition domain-containing protein [Geotalea sp. SG265]|uniref:type IV secretory system conjugative DNA transfer family protein n=1 Tax=Geotalea sp. SG265 TaxID=2922867 RepID=UPI001FB036D7|nr:TraM recognition domain-containing protein [Geotalea sp. SG265]
MLTDEVRGNPLDKRKGILVGVGVNKLEDKGRELVYMNDETMGLHSVILGTTGTGKTTLLRSIINQAIWMGWGVLVADMKFDYNLFTTAYATAYHCGRTGQFQFLSPYAIEKETGLLGQFGSNTYNPLKSIDSSISLTTAILKAAEVTGQKMAFYEDVKEEIVDTLVRAFLSTGKEFSFRDKWCVLEHPQGLRSLISKTTDPEVLVVLQNWLEQWTSSDNRTSAEFQKYVQGAKMFFRKFSTGSLGRMLNSYNPDVTLKQVYNNSGILWVVLPSLLMDTTAKSVGKLLLSDLRYLIGNIQVTTLHRKPFLVVIDEFENFIFDGVTDLFDKGRSADVKMVVSHQSPRQIDKEHSREFRDIIIGNTRTKYLLATEDNEIAKYFAELMGKESDAITVNYGGGISSRDTENYVISPTEITRMKDFELVVRRKGEIYQGHLLAPPSDFELGVDCPNPRFTPRHDRSEGIRIYEEVIGDE